MWHDNWINLEPLLHTNTYMNLSYYRAFLPSITILFSGLSKGTVILASTITIHFVHYFKFLRVNYTQHSEDRRTFHASLRM